MTDANRPILDQFGADSTIDGIDRDVRPGDLFLLLPAVLSTFLIWEATGGLPWPLDVVGVAAGVTPPVVVGVLLYVVPEPEPSAFAWVRQVAGFWRQESERSVVDTNPENRTETETRVERFHPDAGAVERTDGALVGGIRVEPANLSLATGEEWNAAADALGDAFNSLEFDIFIHSTGREVDTETFVEAYEDRADDPDLAGNDRLADLAEHYRLEYEQSFDIAAFNYAVREFYILVSVGEREVQLEDYGAFGRLTNLPLVGGHLRTVAGAASRLTGPETVVEQRRQLASRVEDVEDAIRGVGGCSTEVVSAEELAGVVREFWTGETPEFGGGEAVRSSPVVVSETNDAVGEAR